MVEHGAAEHGADHRAEAANYPRRMSVPESYRLSVPQQITLDIATPERALAIGAHPDDVEFGCGATLAKWAADGCQIFHLICTDGSKGTWDADVDPAELVTTRRREQRNAAQTLGAGADSVVFLDWSDGELESAFVNAGKWRIGYVDFNPTWYSVTIRGGHIGSTPTIVMPGCWPAKASWPPEIPNSFRNKERRRIVQSCCCCGRPPWFITWSR